MKQLKFALIAAVAAVPALAHAQLGNVENILESIGNLVDTATPILVGLAILVFFWGLVKFIFNAGDEDQRKAGRQIMIWGVIAIFVIAALWGLVEFLANAFGVETGGQVEFPTV